MPDSSYSMNEGERHMSQVICHKYILTPKEDMPDSGDNRNKGEWHMSQVSINLEEDIPDSGDSMNKGE